MKIITLFLSLAVAGMLCAQEPYLVLTTKRPPELEVGSYRQIAVGDITGPLGTKTELSMDLADALSTRLFSAQTLELVEKATLDKLLGEQKYRDLQTIDETTVKQINQKLNSALMITGRMQSDNLEQKLYSSSQGIVINGCATTYYYEVKGSLGMQVKIFDLKTGKLIYNEPVTIPIDLRTKEECTTPAKMDVGEIRRQATRNLGEKIAQLVVPFDNRTTLKFFEPGFLKSPFKQLREAVLLLQNNKYDQALAILKSYTEAKEVKQKHKPQAYYNYALGLVYTGKYEDAQSALEKVLSGGAAYAPAVRELNIYIAAEQNAQRKLESMAADREKLDKEAVASKPATNEKPAAKSSGSKTTTTTKKGF